MPRLFLVVKSLQLLNFFLHFRKAAAFSLIVPRLSKRDRFGLVRPSICQALASDALEGLFGAHVVIDAERNAV